MGWNWGLPLVLSQRGGGGIPPDQDRSTYQPEQEIHSNTGPRTGFGAETVTQRGFPAWKGPGTRNKGIDLGPETMGYMNHPT